jgi:hypothetical protein
MIFLKPRLARNSEEMTILEARLDRYSKSMIFVKPKVAMISEPMIILQSLLDWV